MLHGVVQSYMHLMDYDCLPSSDRHAFSAICCAPEVMDHQAPYRLTCSYGSSIDWAYPGYSNCGVANVHEQHDWSPQRDPYRTSVSSKVAYHCAPHRLIPFHISAKVYPEAL